MLEGLFGNIIVEKIFFSLFVYEEVYALGLAKAFDEPVNRFQQQLKRLEGGGCHREQGCRQDQALYHESPISFSKRVDGAGGESLRFCARG